MNTALAKVDFEGTVATVTIDNPPVNAMSRALRIALMEVLDQVDASDARAVVIQCAGRTFVAGADINELEQAQEKPTLPALLERIENMQRPVVCAIHGTALGGGLELALACHWRVSTGDARVGMPEINLGLIPGAGGTQRLPRLIGIEAALEMMLSGKPIGARRAQQLGLLDVLCGGAVGTAARNYAETLQLPDLNAVRSSARTQPENPAADYFQQMRARYQSSHPGHPAYPAVIDSIEDATRLDFCQGQVKARRRFLDLIASTPSRALRYLFLAEREAGKPGENVAKATKRRVDTVGVVGAGTMGAGIAMAFVNAGIPVVLVDRVEVALARGLATIEASYREGIRRGKLDEAAMVQRMSLIETAVGYGALGATDLVIEAVFEELEIKQDVFRALAEVTRADTILATNTSYLDINAIAEASGRPDNVVGLHFFSPANLMKLTEVIRGEACSDDVMATVLSTMRQIGKTSVQAGVCFGFIGNRMLIRYGWEAQQLLLEGATPQAIDAAMEQWGMAMGPLAVTDLAGLDIGYRARKVMPNRPRDPRFFAIGDLLVDAGRLGRKTGAGFYRYTEGGKRTADDEVIAMIGRKAVQLGVEQREIGDPEIVERLTLALVNEAAQLLQEGIARRASDIDVVYTNGYGFPRSRGGPLFYADTLGMAQVYAAMKRLHEEQGSDRWCPAPLIESLAGSGDRITGWSAQTRQTQT